MDEQPLTVFEFQGEFENIELFNGKFNSTSLQMFFEGYYLQGKRIKKDLTILRKDSEGKIHGETVGREVILFDEPPKYYLNNKNQQM